MIIGIGVDLVDMRRIERLIQKFGKRFTHKIFTKEERDYAEGTAHPLCAYANRFAAKEAAVKALRTGMRDGVGWLDIEVFRASSGTPSLYFHRRAFEILESRIPPGLTACIHISLSDEPPYSTAFVVISGISV
jgi:holo-[acyl-carrier protein] synthase